MGKETVGNVWLLLIIVIIGFILILGIAISWYFYRKHRAKTDLQRSSIFLWTPVEDYVNQHLPKPDLNEDVIIERKPTILIPQVISQEKLAIWPFSPRQSDEISIHIGDTVTVQRTYDDGWVLGHNTRSNLSGMFPSTVFSAS